MQPVSSGHTAPPMGLRTVPQTPLSPESSRLTSRQHLHFSEPLLLHYCSCFGNCVLWPGAQVGLTCPHPRTFPEHLLAWAPWVQPAWVVLGGRVSWPLTCTQTCAWWARRSLHGP